MATSNAIKLLRESTHELATSIKDVDEFHRNVFKAAILLKTVFDNGNKVLIAGNGGSAAEAQHFSDEMVGRFKNDRDPKAVIALTADSAVVTCIGNDYGYEYVFSRQVEALGKKGDVFIGLSTSGTSRNIILAVEAARKKGMSIIAMTGPKGTLKDIADVAIIAPTVIAARMQELHLHSIHLICELFEDTRILEMENVEKIQSVAV